MFVGEGSARSMHVPYRFIPPASLQSTTSRTMRVYDPLPSTAEFEFSVIKDINFDPAVPDQELIKWKILRSPDGLFTLESDHNHYRRDEIEGRHNNVVRERTLLNTTISMNGSSPASTCSTDEHSCPTTPPAKTEPGHKINISFLDKEIFSIKLIRQSLSARRKENWLLYVRGQFADS